MPEEVDYKKAYEILRAAIKDADRILRKANLHVSLLLDHDLQNPPGAADAEIQESAAPAAE